MNKSSATIKLTKSEIDWVVISLVHAKKSCEHFSNFDKQYSEEKARTGQEACEECD